MSGNPQVVSTLGEAGGPFKDRPDSYDELVALLWNTNFNRAATKFVSLNYDTLLETALKRDNAQHPAKKEVELHSCYDWQLFKPHGSVNYWGSMAKEISPKGVHFGPIHVCDPFEGLSSLNPNDKEVPMMRIPVMAYFAPGKPSLVNAHDLDEARQKAGDAAKWASHGLIIGVHLPLPSNRCDDPPLTKILEELKPKAKQVLYLAGPPEVGRDDARVAHEDYGFRPVLQGFEQGVGEGGEIENFLMEAL